MRNACPNQKIAITNMNTKGSTKALSTISVPRVSGVRLRHVVHRRLQHASALPTCFTEVRIAASSGQCYAIRNLERLRIIQ